MVILVSGMGMQDRDWSFMGGKYKIAKIITENLNQKGIAVYRYDDRGYGKSTGTPEMTTSFEELAEDISSRYNLKIQAGRWQSWTFGS